MKGFTKVLLAVLSVLLLWVCVRSIKGPRDFERNRAAREQQIIFELQDIRTAQVAYKQEFNVHAATFEELNDWLANGTVRTVRRQMELTEEQLEGGMTEEKAVEIVRKAERTGNWSEAEKEGLSFVQDGVRTSFERDTIRVPALQTVFPEGRKANFGPVPGIPGLTFDMDTASVMTQSGYDIKIFQAAVLYKDYLGDLDQTELANLLDKTDKMDRYPGLKVGSLTEINNNAGNWE